MKTTGLQKREKAYTYVKSKSLSNLSARNLQNCPLQFPQS
jgi:hypothetical protein